MMRMISRSSTVKIERNRCIYQKIRREQPSFNYFDPMSALKQFLEQSTIEPRPMKYRPLPWNIYLRE